MTNTQWAYWIINTNGPIHRPYPSFEIYPTYIPCPFFSGHCQIPTKRCAQAMWAHAFSVWARNMWNCEWIYSSVHTYRLLYIGKPTIHVWILSFFLKLYVSSILIKKTICDLIYQESIYISTDRIPTLVVWILKLMKYYYLDLNGKALIQNTRLLNV